MDGLPRSRTLFLVTAALAAAPLLASEAPKPPKSERQLTEAVAAIVKADYRGERAELLKQAEALSALALEKHARYREYWSGFAYWRRAINGLNEMPAPPDLLADFERCATHERAALALDPNFEDARGALVGCVGGQLFLGAQLSAERRAAIGAEGTTVYKALFGKAEGNPRSLWIVGGYQAFPPPPGKADVGRATATFRRGLAAARAEALAGPRDPWVPAWGAPENFMNLAYLYTHGPEPNRTLALTYAEAALAMVPDWHYVRDILLPQIEKLGDPAAASPKARNKEVARQFLEQAFGPQWKVELAEQLHTADFVIRTAEGDHDLKDDRDALLGWKAATPDLVMTVDDIVAEGDKVAVRWTATGTNTGEGNGLPATGKKVKTTGMTFWRMKDGRIAEEWGVVDTLTMMRQLGLLPEK